ncbi:dynamin-like 120 kDa protein, mitochondrial isoform X2 [Sycon ciliatum]|uniref:dynamin-like 120 kDa protein, mitochondrial isoform X2 n=1 Tax=Sycon ciliatum TaxID=27933 RepID=UPI0031F64521
MSMTATLRALSGSKTHPPHGMARRTVFTKAAKSFARSFGKYSARATVACGAVGVAAYAADQAYQRFLHGTLDKYEAGRDRLRSRWLGARDRALDGANSLRGLFGQFGLQPINDSKPKRTMPRPDDVTDEEIEAALAAAESVAYNASNPDGSLSDKDKELASMKSKIKELSEQLSRAHQERAKSQKEFVEMQNQLQRELEKKEHANRDMKRQLLLQKQDDSSVVSGQRLGEEDEKKRPLIDMYSELLDLLSEYDSGFDVQDHLPRVVVVGDQSAGKTSVLEMIAQARIFPRGGGEMMTRSPVMVTLSEGPHHVAQFKGSMKQYDLTSEKELESLRKEIEQRMRASVSGGKTVSNDVISLSVRGPGLQRVVLVDLPGIISTVTSGMAADTRDNIAAMSRQYMNNPNAIILCIQDGAVDAERSMVTDLVRSMDPSGKRTIFVMTKVDLAEKSAVNPGRIKSIMEGKLFPMKALGYFAVVTGRGNVDDSIETIRQYEEQYFATSSFFRSGALKASQMSTRNLSFAVSRCFWQMVQDSVQQQADTFRAHRYNLESEWKNTFPRLRELDRNELFEKGKDEILDHLAELSRIQPHTWEANLVEQLWKEMSTPVVEDIYFPAAQGTTASNFNTRADIRLRNWANKDLPLLSVQAGWEVLLGNFAAALQPDGKDKQSDLFAALKEEVVKQCRSEHVAIADAVDRLRVIQMNTLEDRAVTNAHQWDDAVKFMETTLTSQLKTAQDKSRDMVGPTATERWFYWQSKSSEQSDRDAAVQELNRLLDANKDHPERLAADELTTVRKNLETRSVSVTDLFIEDTWQHMYREHFLTNALSNMQECKKAFYHRELATSQLRCDDVVLFWRIQRMLHITGNALRQQIESSEARNLARQVKQILDSLAHNPDKKRQLITGRQVELAEELKRVRSIQEKLDTFISTLQEEKRSG